MRARNSDVQPIGQQDELEPARGILRGGCGQRQDGHRGLSTLELVDGADRNVREPCRRETFPQELYLSVVGSHHDDVVLLQRCGVAGGGPGSTEHVADDRDDGIRFLRGECGVAAMEYRARMESRLNSRQMPLGCMREKFALVGQLGDRGADG